MLQFQAVIPVKHVSSLLLTVGQFGEGAKAEVNRLLQEGCTVLVTLTGSLFDGLHQDAQWMSCMPWSLLCTKITTVLVF